MPEGYNHAVEKFRVTEYPQLKGDAYLDHGGTTIPSKSMIDAFAADLTSNLYGNPHSASTPSHYAGYRIDEIRERTLRFFNADPKDFDLVFVANATAAIKLVMECFRDRASDNAARCGQGSDTESVEFWYGYHRDAHNSLVGVREQASSHRCFGDDAQVDEWITKTDSAPFENQLGLFAYPGQSNMTGRRLPLSLSKRIRNSPRGKNTYTLLDAAALATTSQLDLDTVQPDFTAVSFYKIFGFPNLGGLIVRKAASHVLRQRSYFGGGTVDMTSIHERLEDGTLPFHSIFALDAAFTTHKRLFQSMSRISAHTGYLTKYLHDGMTALRHPNYQPLFRIYNNDSAIYGDTKTQGATISCSLLESDGTPITPGDVERTANDQGIFIRSGTLCNPGGVATFLHWDARELRSMHANGRGYCSYPYENYNGKATGVEAPEVSAKKIRTITLHFMEKKPAPQNPRRTKGVSWSRIKASLSRTSKGQSEVVLSV
ncbi:PLP-dependent transferase [Tothia fuscella]|uniref:PLP-dependent transferase n=1 Tax=Tothia fuscella TaxID=1048955 RepID=A0A9P4TVR9_9PEZI|nr:PLP-dependent transferase [Tothia fuscella]